MSSKSGFGRRLVLLVAIGIFFTNQTVLGGLGVVGTEQQTTLAWLTWGAVAWAVVTLMAQRLGGP